MSAAGGERTMERPETLARTAMVVSHLYGLLATIFREEISADVLADVRSAPMVRSLAEVGMVLDEEILCAPEPEVLEKLAVEYAALFLGPGQHISPHESVYSAAGLGTLWGDETVAVRRFIEGAGFRYDDDYRGIPDHISVELDFMYELARRESEAWEADDRAGARNCLEYQQEFMTDHLSTWVSRFCEKVTDTAGMAFYREFARLTSAFIASEAESIAERLEAAQD